MVFGNFLEEELVDIYQHDNYNVPIFHLLIIYIYYFYY